MEKINVDNLNGLPTIDYRTLQRLQGDLKEFKKAEKLKLGKSFLEFGYVFPFFVWFDRAGTPWIVDGHGRHLYMLENECTNQHGGYDFPYIEIPAKDKRQAKKLLLEATQQLQKITKQGFANFIKPLDFEWVKTHLRFDAFSINADPNAPTGKDDGDTKPAQQTSIQPGDLIELGPHRLLCADSTSADNYARLMQGTEPVLLVTDPPYGENYDASWRDEKLAPAKRATGVVTNDHNANWAQAYQLYGGGPAYIWHSDRHAYQVATDLQECGYEIKAQIIWAKNDFRNKQGKLPLAARTMLLRSAGWAPPQLARQQKGNYLMAD